MGIMDKVTALLPARGEQQQQRHQLERRPAHTQALALKDDFDRWLQRFFDEPWGYAIDYPVPLPEVRDTEREFIVSVEVPGFDPKDLDLSITPEGLIIRAERRGGNEQRRLIQTVALPDGLDIDKAEARVDRGVLTVRFPRTAPASTARRIPIRTR
jgi:HSP20 family molecular chaperone IbpA